MFRDDPSLISDTSVIELSKYYYITDYVFHYNILIIHNYVFHCVVRTDDGEWCVGEVMTYPLNYYELKLRKRRQSYQPSIPYPITST